MNNHFSRPMPGPLEPLLDLAMDLRWTGSQTATRVWQRIDPETWERTRNPMTLLMNARQEQLEDAARDEALLEDLQSWLSRVAHHDSEPTWFDAQISGLDHLPSIAYFSMEFGLSEALPIYSGGLGMLAGDHLKSASSLGVPLTGIGLLYQQGYFHQLIDDDGAQVCVYPYNEPGSLPVRPVDGPDGRWLQVPLELPGRTLLLRLWQARVGSIRLLLLDSNDPLNSPRDRAITAQLYNADRQTRLLQELVLGVGGWLSLEQLGIQPDVCHLNEGHAAFAVVARAAAYARQESVPFSTALWATRAGNVFTTHTPVAAAFDRFDPDMVRKLAAPLAEQAGIGMEELLALGQDGPDEPDGGPFNMAFLALRGCAHVNGVSRLHGRVSRRLFAPLFPGWPYSKVPVTHITNGVHVPTWDSTAANVFWRKAYPQSWSRHLDDASQAITTLPDEDLWAFRNSARADLIGYVRHRIARRCRERGVPPSEAERCSSLLDPHALTIGFARRFTAYKRPNLLLHDAERLARILNHPERPVQVLIAGKAHPNDEDGAARVQDIARFAMRPDVSNRIVFLQDYDMAVAQALTGGVDIWLNNPSRPNEACGTSGMKTLANGGLHLSTLDGWWDEAFEPGAGWAFGGCEDDDASSLAADADELYRLLEQEIIPAFYDRDEHGLPRQWLQQVRKSMSTLTPTYSSDRMVREYASRSYLPAARTYRQRAAGHGAIARSLQDWHASMVHAWEAVRFGHCSAQKVEDHWLFEVELTLGGLDPSHVTVQLYCEDPATGQAAPLPMQLMRPPAHAGDCAIYQGQAPADRPQEHFTPRVIASHPEAFTPLEAPFIRWQK